ncbi:hypothetical protein B0T16DRAFT_440771 [Cercophora newfieldiana]|uniref:Uncharacterized protein n=1 Tax=Cercophora newfieldiana TaxID=92897 RepID=A0AA39YNC5_9PEZI|nr:hypothetical protein B0T16DRAFT_440771 [Cercophora newfieldiana]
MTKPPQPSPTIPSGPNALLHPRQEMTDIPELCGFVDRTSAIRCDPGSTCKFNTDYYAVGCCQHDNCNWQTTCCNLGFATVSLGTATSTCGGADGTLIGDCYDPSFPFCITDRYENGYTGSYSCSSDSQSLTRTIFFTTAGQTTAWPGLPRLTGRNGPAPTASLSHQTVVPDSTGLSAGAVAGGVVGGVFFGAVVALLVVFLTWRLRARGREKGPAAASASESGTGTGTSSIGETREESGSGVGQVQVQVQSAESPVQNLSSVSAVEEPRVAPLTVAPVSVAPLDVARVPEIREVLEPDSVLRHELALENGRWELAAR